MKNVMMILIFGVLLLSGCVQDQGESAYDKGEDNAGRDLLTSDDGVRHGDGPNFTKDLDNGMTMTDQNPNLLNTDDDNRHNYSQDVEKAKEVVLMRGYKPGQIWINGDNLNVTVEYHGRMTREKHDRAIRSLKNGLTKALPRYDINVEIE